LGSAIIPTFYALKRTKMASLITGVTIALQAFLSFISLALLNLGLTSVAFSRLFATMGGLVFGTHVLRLSLKIEFDKEAIWKSVVASIVMVLSLFALELLRMLLDPSSYQFLVLRLRQLPLYAAAGIVTYLLSLVALRAVKKRDIELVRDYLPNRLRWIVDVFNRIARAKE